MRQLLLCSRALTTLLIMSNLIGKHSHGCLERDGGWVWGQAERSLLWQSFTERADKRNPSLEKHGYPVSFQFARHILVPQSKEGSGQSKKNLPFFPPRLRTSDCHMLLTSLNRSEELFSNLGNSWIVLVVFLLLIKLCYNILTTPNFQGSVCIELFSCFEYWKLGSFRWIFCQGTPSRTKELGFRVLIVFSRFLHEKFSEKRILRSLKCKVNQ